MSRVLSVFVIPYELYSKSSKGGDTVGDKELIALIRSGDREAFMTLMETYNRLLWVVAGGVLGGVGTREDIEECVSDAYISLWKNPNAYDSSKGSLKTFLAVLTKRRALDKYRRLAKDNAVELSEAIEAPDDLIEYIAAHELYRELYEAINLLREPDKEILIRRYFFDEKPSGIARRTSLPVKEVENRLYQSKLKLRKILQAKEVAGYEL